MANTIKISHRSLLTSAMLLISLSIACTHYVPRFGIGGRYEEGREQFLRGRGGDMDTAIVALESVVSQDPTYKYSLTYLGRAYYLKGRYQDAFAVLQRAVAVHKDDEQAWMALGLAQLRLGQNDTGIESLKGRRLSQLYLLGYPGIDTCVYEAFSFFADQRRGGKRQYYSKYRSAARAD